MEYLAQYIRYKIKKKLNSSLYVYEKANELGTQCSVGKEP